MTLGTLIGSLSRELNLPNLSSLFPYEFRNVLGHGSYWWNENMHFCYKDKETGTEVVLTFAQFMQVMQKFNDSFSLIFREYLSRLSNVSA